MQILEEVTKWEVDYRQPNHVYLLDGDKIVAYQKWGNGDVEYLPTQPNPIGS
jgi:hypothetical protein